MLIIYKLDFASHIVYRLTHVLIILIILCTPHCTAFVILLFVDVYLYSMYDNKILIIIGLSNRDPQGRGGRGRGTWREGGSGRVGKAGEKGRWKQGKGGRGGGRERGGGEEGEGRVWNCPPRTQSWLCH